MEPELHLCGYMSLLGESLRDVARKFSPMSSPQGVAEYLKILVEINVYHQEWNPNMTQSPDFPIRPGTSICLPTVTDLKNAGDKFWKPVHLRREPSLSALRSPNKEGFDTRNNVATIVREHHLPTVGAVSLWTEAMQNLANSNVALGIAGGALTLGEQTADYIKDSLKDTREAMLETQEKLKAYLKAPYGEKIAAKQAYYASHRQVKQKFEDYIKISSEKRAGQLRKLEFVSNRETWLNRVKSGVANSNVTDTEAFQSIVRVSRGATIIGRGCIALQVAMDGTEVYNTYREGGDWFEEMTGDLAGLELGIILGSVFAGVAVALLLTPPGWVIIIAGTAGALTGEWIAKEITNSVFKKI